jgi:hypothetical protein
MARIEGGPLGASVALLSSGTIVSFAINGAGRATSVGKQSPIRG